MVSLSMSLLFTIVSLQLIKTTDSQLQHLFKRVTFAKKKISFTRGYYGKDLLYQHVSCSGIPSWYPDRTVMVICRTNQGSEPTA